MSVFWAMNILANLWLCTALIQYTIDKKEGRMAFCMGFFWIIASLVFGG